MVRVSSQNSAKHDNKWQSRNSANKPVDSNIDFTMLSKAAEVLVPHRETTETSSKLSQIVCAKSCFQWFSDSSEKTLADNIKVSARVKRGEFSKFLISRHSHKAFQELSFKKILQKDIISVQSYWMLKFTTR